MVVIFSSNVKEKLYVEDRIEFEAMNVWSEIVMNIMYRIGH